MAEAQEQSAPGAETTPGATSAATEASPPSESGLGAFKRRFLRRVWDAVVTPLATRLFHVSLLFKTRNFSYTKWQGVTIEQNVFDLWTTQETLAELKPGLLVEIGTRFGGSALFYAQLFDLIGKGRVLTIDIDAAGRPEHPRIEYLTGDSTAPETLEHVRAAADGADGPVMVILDGNHDRDHVARELELYAPLVTPGSYLLSQDGLIDQFRTLREFRPGPLQANRDFVESHPEFEWDEERNHRFLLTAHPVGWLLRRPD